MSDFKKNQGIPLFQDVDASMEKLLPKVTQLLPQKTVNESNINYTELEMVQKVIRK